MTDDHVPNRSRERKTDALAQFRSEVYRALRQSRLTKAEQDVCSVICRVWWRFNRCTSSARGLGARLTPVHPGVEKLAERARVSERTCQYALRMLQHLGILIADQYLTGGRHATRWRVSFTHLFYVAELPRTELRQARKATREGCKIAPLRGANTVQNVHPDIRDILTQNPSSDVIPFPVAPRTKPEGGQ